MKSNKRIVVREAFIIPIFKVIISQFALGNIYFLLMNFYEIQSVATSVILFNGLESAQLLISIIIFLSWYNRYYAISAEEIELNFGAILQKKSTYSLKHLESVTFRKTLSGLFFNHGDVKVSLHYGTDSKILHIRNIDEPAKYAAILNDKLKNKSEAGLFD